VEKAHQPFPLAEPDLTTAFNSGGRLRAVICSGQAVVLHRLAVMSKDGDWILREDEAVLAHVLAVFQDYGANYRFGAPLDLGWLRGGWSSHFEFAFEGLRIRTDFFTRPPRFSGSDLDLLAEALDAERRSLIKRDATRIGAYEQAAIPWREQWPEVRREIEGLPLGEAHRIVLARAEPCLPKKPSLPTA